MNPKKRKVPNGGLPIRPLPLPPRTYGLPLDATKTRHHELHRREVDAGLKRETENQMKMLEQQHLLRRKEMKKAPAVERETSLELMEVRYEFECRIMKDRIWMMVVHSSDTDRTIRLDSELAVPQVSTLAELCYRSRRFEVEGWPPTTLVLKEGQLEGMKKWVQDIPPEGYLTATVWTGTTSPGEPEGLKRTREESEDGVVDSIELKEKRVRIKRNGS